MTETKPKAVIVDLDGTWVDTSSTRQYVIGPKKDFDKFHTATIDCPPHQNIQDWVERHHAAGDVILVVTGRKVRWFDISVQWIRRHSRVPFLGPFMRAEDDNRSSADTKRDIHFWLSMNFDITHAADDDPIVVDMWRSLGIEVHHQPGWDDEVAAAYVEQANKEN